MNTDPFTLYLVRHGKAEQGGDDDARKLSEAGTKAVRRIARALEKAGVRVERVEHSGLVRARETAEILAGAVGGSVKAVSGLGSSDDVAAAAVRFEERDSGSLMLVGHEPFMGRMASYLLAGDAESDLLHFRTGAIACLTAQNGGWVVEWFLSPALT